MTDGGMGLAGFGADDSGVLRLPSCRCVAWRLRNRLGYSALSERIRFDRTVFMKIPALKALAPTVSEPPFLVTQVVVMLIFIVFGVFATRRFPGQPVRATQL